MSELFGIYWVTSTLIFIFNLGDIVENKSIKTKNIIGIVYSPIHFLIVGLIYLGIRLYHHKKINSMLNKDIIQL